ncbi:hypothetical protein FA014_19000 [Cellulomonas hominis]|uniref:Peptidase inhibitor family I36 n=1 Tax=Cellulomonas hominis TaxID=156981 RepID=A0A7Z8JWH3_9CELL|nr:peptidase inhibitor family I36 protein [Cellulomonas hominis]TKR21959.1 hypothetical protein FA014_19000 [Cellulomonas hominis]
MTLHVKPAAARRARAALVGAAFLALSALAPAAGAADDDPAGPVEAIAFSASQCAAGRFCLWSGPGYTGTFWSTASTGLQNTGVTNAGSVWNRMSVDVRTYSGAGGTGSSTCWNVGAQVPVVSVGSASVRTMTATTC